MGGVPTETPELTRQPEQDLGWRTSLGPAPWTEAPSSRCDGADTLYPSLQLNTALSLSSMTAQLVKDGEGNSSRCNGEIPKPEVLLTQH